MNDSPVRHPASKKDQKTRRIRILLADDHEVLRAGLRVLIDSEPDMTVVGEAASGEEAMQGALDASPDVIVMDLHMPGVSGLDAIRLIREQRLPVRIVVLSMFSRHEMVMQAIKAGCDGYVPKSSAHSSLLQAIRVTYAGNRYLHPTAAAAVMDELASEDAKALMLETLSDREKEVIRLTALGFNSREIGDRLALSSKTVETYRQRAMDKLGLNHRSGLVRFALQAGLLEDGEQ